MMNKSKTIEQAIYKSNKVPNTDIQMHVTAILRGEYSLTELLENALQFYSYSGQAHETMLIDSM